MTGRGKLKPPSAFFYLLGLPVAAVASLLLFAVYLGGSVWLGTEAVWLAAGKTPQFTSFVPKLLVPGSTGPQVLAVVIGVLGVLFAICLLKPLLARVRIGNPDIPVSKSEENLLYGFVHQVFRAAGARVPQRLLLSCEVEASATFAGGFFGLFRRQIALAIGVPLLRALTQRELAAVLAHQAGYFRYGTGSRLAFLIRFINSWFDRAVHRRDAWDEVIATFLASDKPWLLLLGGIARFGVQLSRVVLRIFRWTVALLSFFPIRLMEREAVWTELRIAGTTGVVSATYRCASLHEVAREVLNEIQEQWRKRLVAPEDFPRLIAERDAQLPPRARVALCEELSRARPALLDPHISAGERIRLAEELELAGLPLKDTPAADLLTKVDLLSQRATEAYFRNYIAVRRAQMSQRKHASPAV